MKTVRAVLRRRAFARCARPPPRSGRAVPAARDRKGRTVLADRARHRGGERGEGAEVTEKKLLLFALRSVTSVRSCCHSPPLAAISFVSIREDSCPFVFL